MLRARTGSGLGYGTMARLQRKKAVDEVTKERNIVYAGQQPRQNTAVAPKPATKKKRRMKKPQHLVKRKPRNNSSGYPVTIQAEQPRRNRGIRPKHYDRDSVLTPELVCSACMVVIEEVEYRLRKLKNVGVTVGRRLGADGHGINKRLNPGRNEVNVADAMEKACDLTEEYTASGTGKGQRWVRYNARERGESILIESAVVEAETPKKLVGACSDFLEKHEDNLYSALLFGDPDSTIADNFCMTQVEECNGATFDSSKKPSRLFNNKDTDYVPDVVQGETNTQANARKDKDAEFRKKLDARKSYQKEKAARQAKAERLQEAQTPDAAVPGDDRAKEASKEEAAMEGHSGAAREL